MCKLRITEACIKYEKDANKARGLLINQLNKKIAELQGKLQLRNTTANELELNAAKMELESIIEAKANEVIFRNKANWHEHGERNSKYFFSLEKSRSRLKTVHAVRSADGTLIKENNEILSECHNFYAKLYGDNGVQQNRFRLINHFGRTISWDSREKLENEIDIKEVGHALSKFDNCKAPGCNGLPADFFKCFWPKIKWPLFEYYQKCLVNHELGTSARRGILSLIPKKEADLENLSNWRPLTLLNFDYKLLSKVLAIRLQSVLPEIIDEDQTGFMKGRNIMENIRRVIEFVGFSKERKLNNILLSLDFEKCFDSVRLDAIINSFRFFGFGENFVRMSGMLFTNFTLCVQNNGYSSKWIRQERGYHQGCCYSPLAFLLTGQIFALYLKKDSKLEGVDIDNFLFTLVAICG